MPMAFAAVSTVAYPVMIMTSTLREKKFQIEMILTAGGKGA